MERRKFLIGLGALTAGSAAAMGTGAFSSAAIPDRHVTVAIDADDEATIALVAGADPDVTLSTNPGELQLDLTGADGEGVNINSTYTWGDHADPSNDYAFKIVNNDEQEYDDLVLRFELDDDSWVPSGTGWAEPSFIRFQTYGSGHPDHYWGGLKVPNRPAGSPNPGSREMATSNGVDFEVGQEIYVVVDVDTTGSLATVDDELTGTLTVEVVGPGGN